MKVGSGWVRNWISFHASSTFFELALIPSMRPPKKVREPFGPAGCGEVANGAGLPGLRSATCRVSIGEDGVGRRRIAMFPDSMPSTISGAPQQRPGAPRGLWPSCR